MLWSCFSAAGTEGLVRVEEKVNAPKHWDSLNENPVQSIQNLRLAEGSPSNRTVNLNTQQEWLIDNSVNVLEWSSQSLGLNPIKYFWRNISLLIQTRTLFDTFLQIWWRNKLIYILDGILNYSFNINNTSKLISYNHINMSTSIQNAGFYINAAVTHQYSVFALASCCSAALFLDYFEVISHIFSVFSWMAHSQ